MFYYALLLISVVGIAANFSMGKIYQLNTKETMGVILRKSIPISLLAALMFWGMSGFHVVFSPFTVLLSALCAACSILTFIVAFIGYANGSIAVFTMFQMVGGMLLPFIYGIFYGNEVTPCRIIGIVLLIVSVCFPFFGKKQSDGKTRMSPKFIAMCIAIFFINGGISIFSYIHSNSTESSGTMAYLVLKSLIAAAVCIVMFIVYLCLPVGRGDYISDVKPKTRRLLIILLIGMTVVDGLGYWLQLISAEHLPAVALYPMITGGAMVMTALAGRLFFKEKISRLSAIGILLAFVSTFLFMF